MSGIRANIFIPLLSLAIAAQPCFAQFHYFKKSETAASLTRDQFRQANYDLSYTRTWDIFVGFNSTMNTRRVLDEVMTKFQTSEWAPYMNYDEVSKFVAGWVVMMALGRQGFTDAALLKLEDVLVDTAESISHSIIYYNKYESGQFTREKAEEMLGTLLQWTVDAALSEFGFLKRHEAERMYAGLQEAAARVGSGGLKRKFLSRAGWEMANRTGYVWATGLTGASGAIVGAFVSLATVANLTYHWGFYGFLASLGAAMVGVVVGGGAPVCAVQGIGYLHGWCRAKFRSYRSLSQRCASMLSSSGEIVP